MPKKIDWERIKRAYLASGESYATISSRFEVSERAVEKRASEEGWARSREEIHASIPKPTPKPRAVKGSGAIDEISVLENAIADLSAGIADGETPIKSKEAAATALVRLLEYREKLLPSTATDLAGRAIDLGITPEQFMQELQQAWAAQN